MSADSSIGIDAYYKGSNQRLECQMTRSVHNAELLAMFHRRFGIIPDYEAILEFGYRRFLQAGHTIIDVGAHAGRHTAVFSELVGETGAVHAFDPLPFAFNILQARGFTQNVHLYNIALAEEAGMVSFVFAKGAPEESGFRVKTYHTDVVPELIQVEARRLDSFKATFGKVDFIKIDAEGAEIGCMRSAGDIIRNDRPLITVEYGRPSYAAYGDDAGSLYRYARSAGYIIGDLFGACCFDLHSWLNVCDVAYWDWFLIPLERVDEWQARMKV